MGLGLCLWPSIVLSEGCFGQSMLYQYSVVYFFAHRKRTSLCRVTSRNLRHCFSILSVNAFQTETAFPEGWIFWSSNNVCVCIFELVMLKLIFLKIKYIILMYFLVKIILKTIPYTLRNTLLGFLWVALYVHGDKDVSGMLTSFRLKSNFGS